MIGCGGWESAGLEGSSGDVVEGEEGEGRQPNPKGGHPFWKENKLPVNVPGYAEMSATGPYTNSEVEL